MDSINKRRSVIWFLIPILTLYSCSTAKSSKPFINWVETYGTVSGVPNNFQINYFVNNIEYSSRFYKSYYGMPRNDAKFLLKYDSLSPNNVQICYECPIFLPNEEVIKIEGVVSKIFWTGGEGPKYAIEFYYFINGIKLIKEQGLPNDYREKFPILTKGQKYEVEVWIKDSNRAVIFLDRPV